MTKIREKKVEEELSVVLDPAELLDAVTADANPFRAVAQAEAVSNKPTGYEELRDILDLAYDQAAAGKGRDRHAYGPVGFRPWTEQPILANARQVGPGGLALQCMKKSQEACGMAGRGDYTAARAEVLGTIVYAAAMYRLLEEMEEVTA